MNDNTGMKYISENSMDIEGNSLTWRVHSTGRNIIIFIHGWCSVNYFWTPILEKFYEFGSCVTLDLIGHTPSTVHEKFKLYDQWDLFRIQSKAVEQISKGKKVVIIGHSTGAFTALGIAAMYPHLVSKVIAICPFVKGPVVGPLAFFKTASDSSRHVLSSMIFGIFDLSPWFLEFWFGEATWSKKQFLNKPGIKEYIAGYHKYFRKLDHKAMDDFLLILDKSDLIPLLKKMTIPALVMGGIADIVVPSSFAEQAAQAMPKGDYILYTHSGHVPPLEEPGKCIEDMRKFLKKSAKKALRHRFFSNKSGK